MPAYKSQTPLPATEGLSRRVLALPVYSDQSDEEAAYVIDAVKEAVL
jgi:dTDP-4-amino-4,6-dideoxygalactose transaminase